MGSEVDLKIAVDTVVCFGIRMQDRIAEDIRLFWLDHHSFTM